MRLIIQNDRIAGTATDEYDGPDVFLDAPAGFDVQRIGDYRLVDGQIAIDDSARVARLWQAAHEYEYAEISGSAIGMLALGVSLAKPKCIAVQAWITSIWALYYARKASGSVEIEFSVCGPMPHTVPELMDEIGYGG